jgi:hypothetical protein
MLVHTFDCKHDFVLLEFDDVDKGNKDCVSYKVRVISGLELTEAQTIVLT